MDLNKEIKKLENVHLEKPQKVFTMYLNTDPSDPDQQGGEWKIHLKNGLNNFESYLQEDGDSDEKRNYWAVKEKVEKFIEENEQNFAKSVVLFATGDETIWFAERFQMPVKTEFYWEETPVLDQLKEMQNKFPKTGIVLTQKNEIKLIDAQLGMLKDTQLFELDLDTEDWRQHQGPHRAQPSMGSGGAKTSKRDQFEERFEANRYRWYKSVAPKIDKLAKDYEWERLYLVGDKEELKDLQDNMNKEASDMINKNLLDHEEMHVIEEVVQY
ncbi:Protein required for attachment to host cells [Halobacillus dabanensis]|uniref:Protein required for attachment to host cells n=1 Tax=Halobacillus dabanensis TaxID=240302 RepID=A0A1I3R6K5_HALDA|nr:VLRF1 family aeRF1-type release factor [Halobacillus dabanensis]SFJ42233.1 Protein required for attachment to host cells [Halobacillus dabanensis]